MNQEKFELNDLKEISHYLKQYIKYVNEGNQSFPEEHWNPLQLACAIGDVTIVKSILEMRGIDLLQIQNGAAIPRLTPIHLAAIYGHVEILQLLTTPANVNLIDQWGFTPLHYATYHRKIPCIIFLLDIGADATLRSKAGSTVLDIATELKYNDIVDILSPRVILTTDPYYPKFREWLSSLGAGSYINPFLQSGYDLQFIAQHGLQDDDLDAIGIPLTQMGIRKKLKLLHRISEFITLEQNEDSNDENSNDDNDSDNHDGDDDESTEDSNNSDQSDDDDNENT